MKLLTMAGAGLIGFWALFCAAISWMMLVGYFVGFIVTAATAIVMGLLASSMVYDRVARNDNDNDDDNDDGERFNERIYTK
jgi:hypothetical protein